MWPVIAGLVFGLAILVAAWYALRKSASSSADKDAALQREKQAVDRQRDLDAEVLEAERKQRELDEAAKSTITDHAGFLRDALRQ